MAKALPPPDEVREFEIYRFEAWYVGKTMHTVRATITCTKPGKERSWSEEFRSKLTDNMFRAKEWWKAHLRVVQQERELQSDYTRTYVDLVNGRKYQDIPQHERVLIRVAACKAGLGEGWSDIQSLRHETRAASARFKEMVPCVEAYMQADSDWTHDKLFLEIVEDQRLLSEAMAASAAFFKEAGLELN